MKSVMWGAAALALLAIPAVSLAAEFRVGEQPSVGVQERLLQDVYLFGGSVTSAGNALGDVVAGGGNVVISGSVGADVIAGGGNVSILSSVNDDVRVGGGTVVLQGRVGDDVIVGGGTITLGGPGIGGDVVAGGGSIHIDAPVGGNLKVGGGQVYLNAPIAGNVEIDANQLTLGSGAVISGNLTYRAEKELTKEEGAVIRGEVTFEQRQTREVGKAAAAALVSMWVVGKFLALVVCSLIVGLLLRRYSREVVRRAVERPLLELGRGLVVAIVLPVLSVLALTTLVGIPFGILGLLSFAALFVFAWVATPIVVGSVAYRYITKGDWEVSWKSILLGAFLYALIGVVPFVGWLAQCLLMLLTLGTIAIIEWNIVREWR